jgi:hypothetical protein
MFISGVNDTGDKLFGGVNDTADKFISGVNGINDTGEQWSPVTTTPVIYFSPVSTTLVNNYRCHRR